EGMFDTRAKIEEFQKSERINGPLTIKLKITEEKEKQFELDNSDILKSLTGKMVPLTPLPKK
ncbi:MAG: hypothetical protein NT030_03150, partial [Candidatus Saganbacteria bacterium]|nr:hypothetical protein [Candidatus Saganbacteria bacterium]